jgi:hypothetical protein
LRVESADVSALRLSVNLTDTADRTAAGQALVFVTSAPLLLTAVAEAGDLVPGIENRVYVIARAPDGSAVQTKLRVTRNTEDTPREINTDDQGVALISLANVRRPAEVLQVSDDGGLASKTITLPVRPAERGQLLVRPDKVIVRGGETLKVTVLAGDVDTGSQQRTEAARGTRSVTLALRQEGRTVCAGGVILNGNQAQTELKIPAGVSGAVTLEGSLLSDQGAAWADSRMLLVNGDGRVQVAAAADRTQYKPGERAKLTFNVTDAAGAGVPAAVSVVGVDDALLALTGEHPGLAQALAAAGMNLLSQPGFPLDATALSPAEGGTQAAYAALAGAKPKMPLDAPAETVINTAASRVASAEIGRKETAQRLDQWLLGLLGVGLVLLLLRLAFHDFGNIHNAVPTLTLLCCGLGLVGVSGLSGGYGEFLLIMYVALIVSHYCVFRGVEKPANEFANLMIITITADFLIGIAALMALGATRDGLNSLATTFVIGTVVAILWELDAAQPPAARVKVSVGPVVAIGALALLLIGTLFSGSVVRYSKRGYETASAASSKFDSAKETASPPAAVAMPWATVAEARPPAAGPQSLYLNYPETRSFNGTATPKSGELFPKTDSSGPKAALPRLRWDFPETMIFAPQIITDEHGNASLEVPVADSLTKWRVQSDAISATGGTSWAQTHLVVTQPLSVDLTLPTDVTSGDLLHVPAVISNHSDKEKVVDVALESVGATIVSVNGEAVHGRDAPATELRLAAKSVASVEFTLRFDKPTTTNLKITARVAATHESDQVERLLSVLPEGRPVSFTASALIGDDGELDINVPDDALPGTINSSLYLHRGPLAQMLEGLESMLREPNGCFEQTSSATYPNDDPALPQSQRRQQARDRSARAGLHRARLPAPPRLRSRWPQRQFLAVRAGAREHLADGVRPAGVLRHGRRLSC